MNKSRKRKLERDIKNAKNIRNQSQDDQPQLEEYIESKRELLNNLYSDNE